MALTKDKKNEIVAEITQLLKDSKLTVVAEYKGTTVKAIQHVDTSALTGQLLYAFNSEDEVAPAKALADFAKTNPSIQFVGAITAEGTFISADDVKALASLPSKNELIAQVIATLQSPVNDVMNALSGNLHALLDGVEAKAA